MPVESEHSGHEKRTSEESLPWGTVKMRVPGDDWATGPSLDATIEQIYDVLDSFEYEKAMQGLAAINSNKLTDDNIETA